MWRLSSHQYFPTFFVKSPSSARSLPFLIDFCRCTDLLSFSLLYYLSSLLKQSLIQKLFYPLSETYSFDAINHSQNIVESGKIGVNTLREKSPNTELFQVHKVTITNANFFVLTVSCLRTHQRKNFTSNN